ncbi:response regulator [Candidatus Pacearchaeota archaeon]|nr:response regulator [Candidatus Pacearchaeota archaeon]
MEKENLEIKVLLIDDNKKNIESAEKLAEAEPITYLLQTKGYPEAKARIDIKDTALDYEEAIQKLERNNYDCVLTDLFFPKKIGSNDKSLGEKLIKEIGENPNPEIKFTFNALKKYFDEGDEKNQPLGLQMVREAYKRKIPSLIVTNPSGHGSATEAVECYIQDGYFAQKTFEEYGKLHSAKIEEYIGEWTPFEEIIPSKKENPDDWVDTFSIVATNVSIIKRGDKDFKWL